MRCSRTCSHRARLLRRLHQPYRGIGSRATQKCLLQALLEPLPALRRYEAEEKGFERLALLEEAKSMPWNAVWDMFCMRNGVPVGDEFIAGVEEYEAEVTSKRC